MEREAPPYFSQLPIIRPSARRGKSGSEKERKFCRKGRGPARFRESGKQVAGKGNAYRVASFHHGLIVPGLGTTGTVGMIYEASSLSTLPAPLPPATPL